MKDQDPFGIRQALMQLAFTVLFIAFCLHWAAILVAQVWPWLFGILLTLIVGGIVWRIGRWRSDRW